MSWWLLQEPQDRDAREQGFVNSLLQQCPQIARGSLLADRFGALVRNRQPEQLDPFLADATAAEAPREFRGFAKGLLQDYAAVQAALNLEWSQGQVEGQVNRLKLIKRQMYGRAGFDLLRRRVLSAQ